MAARVDAAGVVRVRQTVSRSRLVARIAQLSPCVIGLEACSGAHEWARRFAAFGHTVKLMAPKFVAPYRRGGKNDGNDAEAICEAVSRPSMRFVPVKSVEQQSVLSVHRVRQGFIEERTATINRVRGLLAEFGVVLPQRAVEVRRGAARSLEHLPARAARAVSDLLEHIQLLETRIRSYEQELEAHARTDERAKRIQGLSGVGPLSSSAIVASVAEAREFKNGRQFAAWIGLTPNQYSTGGKARLGHISKRGDAYLRNLLVQGARSVLNSAGMHQDRMSRWILELQPRRGYYRTLVAIANKNARIAWALLAKNETLHRA